VTGLPQLLAYVSVLIRGRPLHGSERYQPFFIVGSGRCGMTLLRAILEAHPALHIPPEHVLGPAIQDYRYFSRLPWHAVLRLVLGRFEYHPDWEAWGLELRPVFEALWARPRGRRDLAAVIDAVYRAHLAQHKPSATRWGDKAPANTFALPGLSAVFPDLRVVHIIRDGRDVVESFLRLLDTDVAGLARHWLRAVRVAQAFGGRHRSHYIEIRYEDLVRRPEATLREVATFLGIEFDERMLRHHELSLPLGDVDRAAHFRGARDAVHANAIGRWRSGLDPVRLREVERVLGPKLRELGYASSPPVPLSLRARGDPH